MANKRKLFQEESKPASKRLCQQDGATPLSNITILQHMPVSTSTPRRAMPRQGHGPSPLGFPRQYPVNSFSESVSSLKLKNQQQISQSEAIYTRNISKQAKTVESFDKTNQSKVSRSKENIHLAGGVAFDGQYDEGVRSVQESNNGIVNRSTSKSSGKLKQQETESDQDSNTANREESQEREGVSDDASQDMDVRSVISTRSNASERSNLRRSERSIPTAGSTTAGPSPTPITKQYPWHLFNKSQSMSMSHRSVAEKSHSSKESKTKGNQSKMTSFLQKTNTEPIVTESVKNRHKSDKSKHKSDNDRKKFDTNKQKSESDGEGNDESQESQKGQKSNSNKTKSSFRKVNGEPSTTAKSKKKTANKPAGSQKNQTNKNKTQLGPEGKKNTKGKVTKNKNIGPKKNLGEEENLMAEKARKSKKKATSKSNSEAEQSDSDFDDPQQTTNGNEKSRRSFSERMASKKANHRYKNIKLSEKKLKQWKPISEKNVAYLSAAMKSNAQKTVHQCKGKYQGDVQKFLSFYENMFISVISEKDLPTSSCKDYEMLEQMIEGMDALEEELNERLKDVDKAVSREERLSEDQEDRIAHLENEMGQSPSSQEDEESEMENTLEEDPLAKSVNEKIYALMGDAN